MSNELDVRWIGEVLLIFNGYQRGMIWPLCFLKLDHPRVCVWDEKYGIKMIEPIFLGKRQSPIHKIAACLRVKDYLGQDKFSCLLPDFQIEFNL